MAHIDPENDPGVSATTDRQPYVAPQMVVIGNARDLLAGGEGTIEDSLPIPDTLQLTNG
ncbi:MAG TPA: hypothetical protein VHK47_09800 [Polyangia bacterium]|jgi:hypothetical protein|nr:hypothetical protein [Polyangia bacterium]